MNKQTKTITLDGAKACIKQMITEWENGIGFEGNERFSEGMQTALNIFNRVEQVNDDDMAVLWMIKEKGLRVDWNPRYGWHTGDWYGFSPVKEAKEMGWEG